MEERAPLRGVFGGPAWSLGRVAGIEIAIDRSWILIFLLITFSLASRFALEQQAWSVPQRWSAALIASVLFFASIVLHELGHSLTALRLGVPVRSITLFLFGGVAALDSEPKRARDEIQIAVAGPLVSGALGFGFLALAAWIPFELARAVGSWLGTINLILAAFNVLPGFPLDGGRVLRGIVWAASGSFEKATRVAAASGAFLAYGLMALGALAALAGGQVLGGLWLVFIGWFLLNAARISVAQATLEDILGRVRCGDVMEAIGDRRLAGRESVEDVVHTSVLKRGVRTLYVADPSDRLLGLVTLAELAGTPPERRGLTSIEQVMRPVQTLATVSPDETTWEAFRRMAERNVNQLPVLEGGRLVGSVTRERLLHLVQAGVALRVA